MVNGGCFLESGCHVFSVGGCRDADGSAATQFVFGCQSEEKHELRKMSGLASTRRNETNTELLLVPGCWTWQRLGSSESLQETNLLHSGVKPL